MAPKTAMRAAPVHVRTVPRSEKRVKGSFRRIVAKAVLKTSPDYQVRHEHVNEATTGV